VPAKETNLFHGWDEPSRFGWQQIVADDWVCTNGAPVSDIHWWGSFLGWTRPNVPPQLPIAFHIAFWTDVPASPPGEPFSHPGRVIHQVICTNVVPRFAGWDVDPRQADCPEAETCFKWDCFLDPNEWFKQPDGTNIFWISIAAIYPTGTQPQFPWGWKTRPREPNNPAPDDAVRIFAPTSPVINSSWQSGSPIEFPAGKSWDMAFVLTSPKTVEKLDFGDAPDGFTAPIYPTFLANNGARHTIAAGMFLGTSIDAEIDGQPNATATGDDLAGVDDEDGVTFLTAPFISGQPGSVSVVASAPGRLNLWIDWNGNGSWAQPGEHVLSDVPVVAGANLLNFVVPAAAVPGTTFARFRFSSLAGLSYTGPAPDGEVEDYRVEIRQTPVVGELDFGDAPTNFYPTLMVNNGARHLILPGFLLGTNIDTELDGQPSPSATGDDSAALDDEDGVNFLTPLRRGSTACVNVWLTSFFGAGLLDAWVDFNRNGVWDPAEQIFSNQPLIGGANGLCFAVPNNARMGRTYSRWRLSTFGGLSPSGLAQNGEVEDYVGLICQKRPSVIVITNIAVTNLVAGGVTNQVVTINWLAEPDVAYQLETAPAMETIPMWSEQGPEVIGPANTLTVTNGPAAHRFFRLKAPYICP
jgi:hypothetical protein